MRKGAFLFTLFAFLPVCGQHSKYIQAVDEYVPAPGQFVNVLPAYEEGDTPETMAQKCTARIANGQGESVTLGAYGGYIVFHFDHPVVNIAGQKDFAVWGNAFENNAEPAIVMVSVDSNSNGKPDDVWYELKGSEYDNPATIHNYTISYLFQAMQSINWTDNQGQTGVVARNSYHTQEYFPLWLAFQETLTFTGARLPNNASWSGSQFLLPAYSYGYADNQPNENADGCGLDISWAVDSEGNPVSLDHIDFVKCYNAMNQYCGWIGETSSEILGAEDLHLDISLGFEEPGITKGQTLGEVYDLQGRQVMSPRKGLYIRNGKKFFIK